MTVLHCNIKFRIGKKNNLLLISDLYKIETEKVLAYSDYH